MSVWVDLFQHVKTKRWPGGPGNEQNGTTNLIQVSWFSPGTDILTRYNSTNQVAFIKQEALEKARETKIKADEEFQIEKGKLVRQESAHIEAFFLKKVKQFDISCKINASHVTNKNRLLVLEQRNVLLAELVAGAKAQLSAIEGYSDLLKNLVLQVHLLNQGHWNLIKALYKLMEKNVVVQARKQDFKLIESILPLAAQEYTAVFNTLCEPVLDTEHPLDDSCQGGVVVSCFEGRIKVRLVSI